MYFKLVSLFLFITNCPKLINSEFRSSNSSETNSNNNINDGEACLIESSVAGKRILGDYRESENGVPYCAYLGIPFAKPPIGELRFKPPESVDFIYVYISIYTLPGHPCISKSNITGRQSEDCLYLNIFIPLSVLRSNHQNAVVVWIHGGSYNVGSGLHNMHPIRGPELYIENEMIFVSCNYRLGPLGFLRVPELNITGNYGLMDQRFALKWVHENIHLWNGDKNNVTLMGWSAGSASASYHLLANESNQYFNRVVLMSGSLLNPWAQFDYPEVCLKQLLEQLEIERQHVYRLFTINGTDFNRDRSVFLTFGLVNECFVPTVDHVLVSDTIDYKLNKNIDIMIGWTNLEMQKFDLQIVTQWQKYNPFKYSMAVHISECNKRRLFKYLENEFYNNTAEYLDANLHEWVSNDTEIFYRLESKLMSDTKVKYGIRNFVKNLEIFNRPQSLNIFVYQFSYAGKFVMLDTFNDGLEGATHGDDLALMYRTQENLRENKANYDEEYKNELFVQRSLIKMWTNFMKYGNPTPTPIAATSHEIEKSLRWEKHKVQRQLLDINLEIKMVPDTDDAFFQLWQRIENCIRNKICSFLDVFTVCNRVIDIRS